MENKAREFWAYFEQNSSAFEVISELDAKVKKGLAQGLEQRLTSCCPGLGFVLHVGGLKNELTITANGNPLFFQAVELLVSFAPEFGQWKITAFVQREMNPWRYAQGTDRPFELYGIELKVSELYFVPLGTADIFGVSGIRVLLINFKAYCCHPHLKDIICLILEQLIGEKSLDSDLDFVEIGQLEAGMSGLIELYHLGAFLDCFK
jgi:hypothetical protein